MRIGRGLGVGGIGLVALVAVPSAVAQEQQSVSRLFRIEDVQSVQETTVTLPLTVTLVPAILENVGVVVTVRGDAEFGVYMEGQSDVRWPRPDGSTGVLHRVTPLANTSFVGLRTGIALEVEVTGTLFGNAFSQSLASERVVFEDEVSAFTPFLLPNQPDGATEITLTPTATNGIASLPLTIIPGSAGNGPGLQFTAVIAPDASGTVRGVSFDTEIRRPDGFVDTFATDGSDQTAVGTFENPVDLVDPVRDLTVTNVWNASFDTDIGYGITLSVGGTVAGFSFSVPILDESIALFQGVAEQRAFAAHPDTAPYAHPLPIVGVGGEAISFVDVPVGEASRLAFPIDNRGGLDLVVQVAIEGAEGVTVAPPEVVVGPDGASPVTLTFDPPAVGAVEGVLVLTTSDPVRPVVRVPITASAVEGSRDGGLDDGPGASNNVRYESCGCASGAGPWSPWWIAVAAGAAMRRRRPAAPGSARA